MNDLEIEINGKWKKIGPQSLAFNGEIAVERLGLTVTPIPMHLAEKAIIPPPEKFADKEAKSISERVGSLEEGLGRPVSIAEAKGMMIRAVEETFGVTLHPGEITEPEKEYRGPLAMYDKDEWFFAKSTRGVSPTFPRERRFPSSFTRSPGGLSSGSILYFPGAGSTISYSPEICSLPEGKCRKK